MKRITSFLISLLVVLATMAQSSTKTFTVSPSDGSYNSAGWCYKWASNSNDYPVEISVAGNINNMNAATTSGGFEMAVGSNGNSNYTWNFSVRGYKIESYSFKFKSKNDNQNINVVAGDQTITSSYSTQNTLTVNNVNAQVASFQLTGNNYAIIVTELTFTVSPILEEGQVYRFNNVLYPSYSLNANSATDVDCVATNENDIKQQWYVTKENGMYVLRNLAYGKYLKGNGQSAAWSMTDDYSNDYNKFELYVSNTTYNTLHTNTLQNYAYIHCNSSKNIVGWSNSTSDSGSHWEITKVEYTDAEIKALLDAAPTITEVEAYDDALAAIFADGACTILKDDYASMSVEDIKADGYYIALPATLQKMVLKVRNNEWAEDNADDAKGDWSGEYAKKFRVQMYEPYSIAGDITSWIGINSHANNDNPTGIYVPAAGNVFIMVEGEIKQGATLRIVEAGSNNRILNATTGGNTLRQGLNVVNFTQAGGMLYICYNVDTYNPNGIDDATRFPYKLSEFAPLKIHIEGGAINGFYNACGDFLAGKTYDGVTYNGDLWKEITGASVDNDADWEYMEARANLSVLPVLGHRQILLFSLGETEGNNGMAYYLPENIEVPQTPYNRTKKWSDYDMGCDPSTGRINIMVEAWDRIMYSELATMGLVSKADMTKINDFYPRWNADGTVAAEIYDYSNASSIDGKTLEEFCGVDYSDVFNHHGVALGVGGNSYMYGGGDHCGYNHNTMNGVIQRLASDAGSTWGPGHEIGHQHQALLTLNGLTEVTNNLFANVALWYKGMSTSRYNGNEGSLEQVLGAFNSEGSDIYTNNIWALTHLYYRLWLYYHLAGNNTQFYPRLFELLRHNPMQKGYNVSGDVSTLHFYKLACQAAGEDLTEFFRAHGYFSIMDDRLVGDYSNSVYEVSQEMIDEAIAEVKEMGYEENLAIIFICDDDENATYVQHDGQTQRVIYGETTPNSDFGSVSDFIAGDVATTPYTATLNSDGTITMSGGEGGVGFLIVNEKGELVSFSNKSTFALSDEAMEAIVSGNATIKAVGSESNVVAAEVDITAMQKDVLGILISKAQAIIDKIDDTYTKIGYFKGAAIADLASALDYAKKVYESSSGYEAAYDLLYAEYQKVLENPDAKIPFDPSLTYIITNKAYTNETMWVNSEKTVRSEGGVDKTSNDARWVFEETTTAGVYNIRTLNNDYIPAVQQSTSMTATTGQADNDALYTLEEVKDGVWAIKLSPAAGYRNLHSSWNNVVGWETGADASRWYLTAVAANPVIADLTDLEVYINKTETLIDEVLGTVTYTKGESLELQTTTQGSANYLWSNAPETREGDIANLVDGETNDYFHTDWSSEPTSGTHYLAVYLGEDNTLSRFTFSHTTRSGASSDFPKSVDVYGSNDGTTYKFIGSASGMPQSAGTTWEFDGVMLSSFKYLRFNYHANRGYWHMAEFDITRVTGFTATVNDTYSSTVGVDEVTAAMNAMLEGKVVANSFSPTTGDVAAKLAALQDAYNALYTQYEATINARKATLAELAAQTETLINQVGTVELAQEDKLPLTTDNLYCNAPYTAQNNNDNSAEYVDKLTDGDKTTYLHTDYSGAVAAPHYLRVDLGSNSTTTKFRFNYSTRDNGNNCPTTIVVEGCNEADGTYTTITTLTTADGLPNPGQNTNGGVAEDFESSVISMSEAYRYVRFKVTGVEGSNATFFVISEFGFSTVKEQEINVALSYKECVSDDLLLTTVLATNSSKAMSSNDLVTSVPMLDAQILNQQITKAALEEAMQNKPALDKTALQTLYNDAVALYSKMTGGEFDYTPSALTDEMLTAANDALVAAQEQLDAQDTTQDAIEQAKATLQAAYNALLLVEEANVATTIDKTDLNTAITNANALVASITDKGDGYYSTATGLGLDALNAALNAAVDARDRYYLTEEQYTTLLGTLNTCYVATETVVNADCVDRTALTAAIADANTLVAAIADEVEATALPLQVTNANEAYYIWCNEPADDSDGVAGLIDKNSDGTANIGTFLGTDWGADVEPYTHYIEIDLGAENAIDKLSMDYTTRNSTYADQRPNAIKILGSNDKETYTLITEITEGLAANSAEKWSMAAPLELGDSYRYIRIAVGSQRGFFHMADFNLYTLVSSYLLRDYYTTAERLGFDELCLALQQAEAVSGKYVTTEQCATICSALEEACTTTQGVVNNDYTDDNRSALAALAAEVAPLADGVVTVVEGETPITLQCDNESAPYYIYCNAPETTDTYPGDNLGVDALLDVDANGEPVTTTHLHTTYSGNDHYDDLDHYLRVDMGESNLVSFKFGYINRNGNTNDAPKVILIEGSNDCVNFEEITTLTNLPTRYQSDEITNGKAYRYIRFMVKATHSDNSHPYFAISHFEMTACKTIAIGEGYTSPELTVKVAADIHNALFDANNIDGHYLANEDGEALKRDLQAAKELLLSITDKTALNDLIATTTLLKNSLYEIAVVSCTATDVALQCTDVAAAGYLYCNAPETNSGWASDYGGVSAAIDLTEGGDPDLSTFLHTEYGNDQSADGLDHYLRVDLGAEGATAYVEFGYVGRSGHETKSPETVIVAATNDLNGEWTTIKTITLSQPSATAETKTGALGNGVAYRYWRFMVTDTHFDGADDNGHKYFALSDFNVYKCTDVVLDSQLKSEYTPNIYIYATTELVSEVEGAIVAAQEVADATVGQSEVDAAVEALQVKYDKLVEAIENYWCPVTLTTDENNPVLYTINAIGRGDGKAWQYSISNNNITIVDKDANNLYHLWYFIAGTEEHTVKIVPVMTPSYKLGATDFTNGVNKVSAVAESSVDWVFAYVNSNYNFKPYGRNTYFSNYNGGSNPLGFYDAADGGSYVSFTKVELENYALKRLQALNASVASKNAVVTDEPTAGYYTPATAQAFATSKTTAEQMATAATATPEEYVAKFTELYNASHALEVVLPEEGDMYVLRSKYIANHNVFVNDVNYARYSNAKDATGSDAVWLFEGAVNGTLKLKSLHTQSYIPTLSATGAFALSQDAGNITLVAAGDGSVEIKGGDYGLHANSGTGADCQLIAWGSGGANYFYLDKVTNIEDVKYTTTISSRYKYSTLQLGYNAVVPEGVTAYVAVSNDDSYVYLDEVGNIIPANTAVILKAEDNLANYTVEFKYTTEEADEVSGNLLDGVLWKQLVNIDPAAVNAYMLMARSGVLKLYRVYSEYDANDAVNAPSYSGTDNGTHTVCAANRAYLTLSKGNQGASEAQALSFRFDWGGTTGVESVEPEGVSEKTIFDLQGRKLQGVTAPGFYIVNGTKVYIRDVE